MSTILSTWIDIEICTPANIETASGPNSRSYGGNVTLLKNVTQIKIKAVRFSFSEQGIQLQKKK